MNSPDKRKIAALARQAWRHRQLQRQLARERAPGFRALQPPGFNPGDIVDATDGTLNASVIAAGQGLTVLIPLWLPHAQQPGQVDTLELEWAAGETPDEGDYQLVDLQAFEGPLDASHFPKAFLIPAELLRPDGTYALRYRVTTWNGERTTAEAVPVRCDSRAPGDGVPPAAPGIPDEPITDDYLSNNPAGVAWTLPGYAGAQPGDHVRFWWMGDPPGDPAAVAPAGEVVIGPIPMTLHVPPDVVGALGDGGCHLLYQLRDKAGNASHVSSIVRVPVALGPLPQPLEIPQVPRAADGLVDLLDASLGIEVYIPHVPHPKPTDRVEVTWGSTALAERALGMLPAFPLRISVPHNVLRSTYCDATGSVPTPVSYRVLRGDVPFAAEGISVDVDFSVAGPELPGWPDLENPNLSAPRVFGAVSEQLNVLTRDDGEQPVAVRLELYSPLHEGELIEIYWNLQPVPEATHTVGPGDMPGTSVEVSIPWTYIAQAGNHPALPVHYRVRAPGSPNAQRSPTTTVHADAFTLVAPAPTIQNTVGAGVINCDSLDGDDHALLVAIPDLSEWLRDGDTVDLRYAPLSRIENGEVVDECVLEQTITLGEDGNAVTGFIWRITPYEKHILPICMIDAPVQGNSGRAQVRYSFVFEGETIYSALEDKLLAAWTANTCCTFTNVQGGECGCGCSGRKASH